MLNGLVIQAYNQNLPLREAGFRVLAARASYNIKIGGFFPQGQSALATYNRYQLSNNVTALNNLSTTAFSIFSTGFNLSWELDLWGKIRRGIESAEAQYQASIEEYDGVLVTLVADVADRYTDYRVAEKQVHDLKLLAEIQAKSLQVATDRFEGGATTELDVQQAKLNLAENSRADSPPTRCASCWASPRPNSPAGWANSRSRSLRHRSRRASQPTCCGAGRTCGRRSGSWRRRAPR